MAGRRHFIDLSHRMRYVSGRSRVRLVGFSELGEIVMNGRTAAFGKLAAVAAAVVPLLFLLLQDVPDGDLPPLAGAPPIGELFEAPGASVEVPLADHLDGAEDFHLDALLVFQNEPGCVQFLVRVVRQVQNGSDHDDFVKGDGFLLFLLLLRFFLLFLLFLVLFVEWSNHDNLVERDGLSGSGRAIQRRGRRVVLVCVVAIAAVIRLWVLGRLLLPGVRR